jgi:quercetin dioxygenase-like cupin family protein
METAVNLPKVISAKAGSKMNVLGHDVTIKLHSRDAGNNYVLELITPPGFGIPPHVHRNEDEIIYVMSGEFEIMVDGEVFKATSGDYLNFIRHVPHAFKNIGTLPGKTLWHVNPGEEFEEFFVKLGAFPPGPPDPEKLAALFADYGMALLM